MSVHAKEREVTSASRGAQHSQVGAQCPALSKGLLEAGLLTGIPLGLEMQVAETECVKNRIKRMSGLWKTAFGI